MSGESTKTHLEKTRVITRTLTLHDPLGQFRGRIEAVRDNPERVAAEVRDFLTQYKERAAQQALRTAAAVQKGASVGAWVTFGVLTLTLIAAIVGALAGVPSLQTWRTRWAHSGAA